MTPGFSGAEIENLVNTALISAVDKDLMEIDKEEIEEARDRVLTGIKRKIPKQNMKRLIHTAVHESGHVLTCYLDPICQKNIHKVSIIPRGTQASKTYSLSDENIQGTKEELFSMIDMSLGGIFAEEIYFGKDNRSEGCGDSDLARATGLAKKMIKNFGMSGDEYGYAVVHDDHYVVDHKISEYTRDTLDKTVLELINKRSGIVKTNILKNAEYLNDISRNLIEYEELTRKDLDLIFAKQEISGKPKKNAEVLRKFSEIGKDEYNI